MKSFFILILLSIATLSNASTWEEQTYTKSWFDYDSSWNSSCRNFIMASMREKGCSEEVLRSAQFSDITEMSNGGSLVCIYNAKGGVYQVMASQMAEPHQAVLLFSRWD